MSKQITKSALRAFSMSCMLLFILIALCALTLAQSQDPSNPTPITSSMVEGESGPGGATYYYRFKAQKGSVTITLKGQTNNYSTQFEADLLNTNNEDLGKIYVSADDTAKSESKSFNFESAQDVTIVVKLLKDDSLKWQKYSLTFSGAVGFGGSGAGGGEPSGSTRGLPDLVFGKVEYEEGGQGLTPGYHKAKASFCVKNAGTAKAGPFQVRLTIHSGDDQHSGLVGEPTYANFNPMSPGTEVCSSISLEGPNPIFIGKSRLLWIDPGNVGMVKESNEDNNKSWTNFPPKGVN